METTRTIEQYLEGTLKDEERQAVEDRAKLNANFRKMIRLHKEVNESIRDTNLSEFYDLIRKVSGDYFHSSDSVLQAHEKKHRPVSHRIIFCIAAMLIFAAIAGAILKLTVSKGMSAAELYQKYYSVYDADVIYRSAQAEETALDKAIMSYDMGHYSEALKMLNEIADNDHDNCLALFYRGLTCMETDDMERAIRSFRDIPVDWNSPFNEHRNWYLALSLLNSNHEEEAAEIFQQISAGKGYYAEQASLILQKLKF
jgi:tetratricopeptide (TPR) repeat protein